MADLTLPTNATSGWFVETMQDYFTAGSGFRWLTDDIRVALFQSTLSGDSNWGPGPSATPTFNGTWGVSSANHPISAPGDYAYPGSNNTTGTVTYAMPITAYGYNPFAAQALPAYGGTSATSAAPAHGEIADNGGEETSAFNNATWSPTATTGFGTFGKYYAGGQPLGLTNGSTSPSAVAASSNRVLRAYLDYSGTAKAYLQYSSLTNTCWPNCALSTSDKATFGNQSPTPNYGAACGLIYHNTGTADTRRAIALVNFGSQYFVNNGQFQIVWNSLGIIGIALGTAA